MMKLKVEQDVVTYNVAIAAWFSLEFRMPSIMCGTFPDSTLRSCSGLRSRPAVGALPLPASAPRVQKPIFSYSMLQ